METDNEVSGTGNSYTTEFRQYDPRLGRWKITDPKKMLFPSSSPYDCFSNNPIVFTDPSGDIPWPKITGSKNVRSKLKPLRKLPGENPKPHQGLDISAVIGTDVNSAADGKVLAIGGGFFADNFENGKDYDDGGGWGNYIVIDHGNGIITLYAHLKQGSIQNLKVGDKVYNGQKIGEVGNSGHSKGAHLHIEAIYNPNKSKMYSAKRDIKNGRVFSLQDVNDLQNVVIGLEQPTVMMLDGTMVTIVVGTNNIRQPLEIFNLKRLPVLGTKIVEYDLKPEKLDVEKDYINKYKPTFNPDKDLMWLYCSIKFRLSISIEKIKQEDKPYDPGLRTGNDSKKTNN